MKRLSVVPFGSIEEPVLLSVVRTVEETFRFDVVRMPAVDMPDIGFDRHTEQYEASSLLRHVVRSLPHDAIKILGITRCDLYIPMLSFVFGFAQVNGPAAVISLARLRQEFYAFPPRPDLLALRAAKEAVHEMGHCFGLLHCPERTCAMSLSHSVQGVDGKLSDLCPACSMLYSEQYAIQSRTNEKENAQ